MNERKCTNVPDQPWKSETAKTLNSSINVSVVIKECINILIWLNIKKTKERTVKYCGQKCLSATLDRNNFRFEKWLRSYIWEAHTHTELSLNAKFKCCQIYVKINVVYYFQN